MFDGLVSLFKLTDYVTMYVTMFILALFGQWFCTEQPRSSSLGSQLGLLAPLVFLLLARGGTYKGSIMSCTVCIY